MTPDPHLTPPDPLRERRRASEDELVDGFLDWMRDHGSQTGHSCFAGKYWPHDDIAEFFRWYTDEAGLEIISLDRFRVLLSSRPGVVAARRRIAGGEQYAALRGYLARLVSRQPSERYHIYRIASRAEMASTGAARGVERRADQTSGLRLAA